MSISVAVAVLHHLVQRGVVAPEVVVAQLDGLVALPRVSAIAMFASKLDQERLRLFNIAYCMF